MTPDLHTQLARIAEATDPASDPIDLAELVSRGPDRRRPGRVGPVTLRIAAGVLVAGLVAAVAAAVASDPEVTERVYSSVAPTASETANADLLAPGEIQALPPAPIAGRWGAATVWTGTEVFVWGGGDERAGRTYGDGATFDVRRGRWTALPPSPLPARDDPRAVWTGTEVLVWGGFVSKDLPDGEDPRRADGAAYDPATRTWRVIADAPLAGDGFARAVWTGHEMVVLSGRDPAEGAAYDPAADEWRRIADPPMPLAQAHPQAVWTGDRVVAPLGATGDVDTTGLFAYDPVEDRWEELEQPGGAVRADRVVWAGDRLLQIPVDRAPEARDPVTGRWSVTGDVPPAVVATTRKAPQALWTGRRVVVWGPGFAAALDPVRGTWAVTGQDRQPTDADAGASVAWADGVLFAWGGFPDVGDGALIRPADPTAVPPAGPDGTAPCPAAQECPAGDTADDSAPDRTDVPPGVQEPATVRLRPADWSETVEAGSGNAFTGAPYRVVDATGATVTTGSAGFHGEAIVTLPPGTYTVVVDRLVDGAECGFSRTLAARASVIQDVELTCPP